MSIEKVFYNKDLLNLIVNKLTKKEKDVLSLVCKFFAINIIDYKYFYYLTTIDKFKIKPINKIKIKKLNIDGTNETTNDYLNEIQNYKNLKSVFINKLSKSISFSNLKKLKIVCVYFKTDTIYLNSIDEIDITAQRMSNWDNCWFDFNNIRKIKLRSFIKTEKLNCDELTYNMDEMYILPSTIRKNNISKLKIKINDKKNIKKLVINDDFSIPLLKYLQLPIVFKDPFKIPNNLETLDIKNPDYDVNLLDFSEIKENLLIIIGDKKMIYSGVPPKLVNL